MTRFRRLKHSLARVTGVHAALDRRIRAVEDKHGRETQILATALEAAEQELLDTQSRAEKAEYEYRKARRVATGYADIAVLFDQLPRHEYGSLTPGVKGWSEKWAEAEGLKILMFANRDFAGSFYKWTAAINDHTEHAARLVVTAPHRYGYQMDLLLPNPSLVTSSWIDLWKQADVMHLKDETGFHKGPHVLPQEMLADFDGPRIFTQYGGYARKQQDDLDYRRFVSQFDRTVSMTPDLCFDWLGDNPIYIPHSIDTLRFGFEWTDKSVIGHSPSTRSRKGTEEFLEALRLVQDEKDLKLDLIEGLPHAEVMDRKRNLGLFFDQAGRESVETLGTDKVIGWYGNSAIEAAVFGVPTIAHLSEAALVGAERAGITDIRGIPILNTEPGTKGLRDTILTYLDLSYVEKSTLANDTRRFVERFHGQQPVAERLSELYAELL